MVETTQDAREKAEDDAVIDGIPSFANPFSGNVAEFNISDHKGFVTLALESVLVMFWGKEERHEYYSRVGFDVRDDAEIAIQARARLSDEDPLDPRSQILELPENSGGSVVDAVFRDADAMYRAALNEVPLNNGFREAATPPPAQPAVIDNTVTFDPNMPGPF